jgi:UDP-N-acetylglucosamine transferase subunit ALG13
MVAGSGDSLELLRREFPGLSFFALPGYAPTYPRNGSMVFHMARQLPRFMTVISDEHRAVEKLIRRENIDLLISDNRYGCWSDQTVSVFITHQSNIMMPKRFGILQTFVRKKTEQVMNRFPVCWIPDLPSTGSLAGDLVSFDKMNLRSNVEYIGWLSRFEKQEVEQEEQLDVLAILSGPEPQRSILENKVVPALRRSGVNYRIVRGLPRAENQIAEDGVVDFLTSVELQALIQASSLIIARSGYSTVMDMCALRKKAVLIPTPGQTEQEYLAKRLMEKNIAFSMPQAQFDLATAIAESKKFFGFPPCPKNSLLRDAIAKLIE